MPTAHKSEYVRQYFCGGSLSCLLLVSVSHFVFSLAKACAAKIKFSKGRRVTYLAEEIMCVFEDI